MSRHKYAPKRKDTVKTRLALLLVLSVILFAAAQVPNTNAMVAYSFQVGAWGDNSSIGSRGVQAEIQTIIQPLQLPDLVNAFWVGMNLQGRGFIQFGYLAQNGVFCNQGLQTANIPNPDCTGFDQQLVPSKPVWFYQYWPSILTQTFYFGNGEDGSAGVNGTWNTYTIQPAHNNTWLFKMNGETVGNLNIPPVPSSSAAYMEAEKVSDSATTGPLGPVEFRNLQYYDGASWQYVNSLSVLRSCGEGMECANFPFGVSVIADNDVLVGSNQPVLRSNAILTSGGIAPSTLDVQNTTQVTTLNETNLILQELNQTSLLQQEIEQAISTQQELNGTYHVTLVIPSMINVTVDGVEVGSGPVLQLQLSQGIHTISVPAQIQLNGTNIQFAGWVDASGLAMGQSTTTIDFTSNLVMQANYQPVWTT
ncbi:MAG TPA: hypothetical protein VJZ03_07745 [Candidatus Bathyarchaeia archaeon]|nr:hypothetical protein [Candidatus Bathyarchaeia archaeon]